MRAVYSRPSEVLAGWRLAWAERAENPLLVYWHRQDCASVRQSPWYRRQPLLLFSAALLSLAACIALLTSESLQLGSTPGSLEAMVRGGRILRLQISVLALAVHGFALLWLVNSFGACAALALGFLEAQPKQTLRRNMDDLLAVSQLSEQQVLLGLLLHVLRRLALPLLLTVLSAAALTWFGQETLGFSFELEGLRGPPLRWQELLPLILGTYLTGLGGSVCLTLLLVSLSLSPRTGHLPASGAWLQSQTQFWLIPLAVMAVALAPYASQESWLADVPSILALAVACWLQIVLGLYVARRWDWLRLLMGHSIAGPLLCVLLPLYGVLLYTGDILAPANALALGGFAVLYALSLYNPLPFLLATGGITPAALKMLLAFIGIQLLSILVLAGMARDAIQRRKWEGR